MTFEANRKSPDYVKISIPITQKGKYRVKKPNEDINGLDIVHPTRTSPITEDCYVEWQVGYDVPVSRADDLKFNQDTILEDKTFTGGQNDVEKYPYEIATFLLQAIKNGIIDAEELDELIKDVEKNTDNIEQQFKPNIMQYGSGLKFNGLSYRGLSVTLPAFIFKIPNTKITVRINIEKQQKGLGYQPMLYLCIPITALEDGDRYIGKCAKEKEVGILKITEQTQNVLTFTVLLLSYLSEQHKKDVLSILRLLKEYIKEDQNK